MMNLLYAIAPMIGIIIWTTACAIKAYKDDKKTWKNWK